MNGFAATYLPARWSLDAFAAMRPLYQAGAKPITRYSLKYLRYSFTRHLLERHAEWIGRDTSIASLRASTRGERSGPPKKASICPLSMPDLEYPQRS